MADSASRREGGSGPLKIYDNKNGARAGWTTFAIITLIVRIIIYVKVRTAEGSASADRPVRTLAPYPTYLTCTLVYAGSRARHLAVL